MSLKDLGSPVSYLIVERGARERSPTAKKKWSSIHPRKFDYDVSVHAHVRTDARGGGRESRVSPTGQDYSWGEILYLKHPACFGGKSHGRPNI